MATGPVQLCKVPDAQAAQNCCTGTQWVWNRQGQTSPCVVGEGNSQHVHEPQCPTLHCASAVMQKLGDSQWACHGLLVKGPSYLPSCNSISGLLQGTTKVALYGLGNVRDERLGRMFQTPGCVDWCDLSFGDRG